LGPHVLTLQGKATIDGQTVTQAVSVRAAASQNLAGLPFPPRELHTQVGLAVKEKAPFTLAARLDDNGGVPGLPLNVTLTATRDAGFEEEVALVPPSGLPPNVKPPALKPIVKGQKEVKVSIALDPKTPLGQFTLLFQGTAKHQGKVFSTPALPVELAVTKPFELKVEPATLTLDPEGKAKLKIVAVRKGGYAGPI